MSVGGNYSPGPASGARIDKRGEQWTLVIERQLRHSQERVWKALTDPAQLRQWAPYDASADLGQTGRKVTLTTVGAPVLLESETTITRAERPSLLEFSWGGNDMRWELEPDGSGTRLTLWHNIDRRFIAMGAAGWHVCLDVMDRVLDGNPIGRIVGGDAMKFDGWHRLHSEYAKQFGIELPSVQGKPQGT